jgi:thymidylate synthase (FAD)
VLDLKVKLLTYTPKPDIACAAAAHTTWKKEAPSDTFEKMSEEDAKKFLKRVMALGHLSVIEHASFTFSISGVSRACTHQLVRHRIASYTQQSQRYVKFEENEVECIVPPTIKGDKRDKFMATMKELAKSYKELLDSGVPAEDARYLLPNAATTQIFVTMNARELMHFFGLRCCTRAQWEIRDMSNKMLAEVRKVAPTIFEAAGPNCVLMGYCPEGRNSCGLYPTKEQVLEAAGKAGLKGRI